MKNTDVCIDRIVGVTVLEHVYQLSLLLQEDNGIVDRFKLNLMRLQVFVRLLDVFRRRVATCDGSADLMDNEVYRRIELEEFWRRSNEGWGRRAANRIRGRRRRRRGSAAAAAARAARRRKRSAAAAACAARGR